MHDRSFVTHLEAAIDGTRLDANQLQTVHDGRPLWVRYDVDAVSSAVRRDDLAARPRSMWRYRELLPYHSSADVVSLGETVTPLLNCPRLAQHLGVKEILVKDESRLPTGSFKSRGMAMAITMARQFGVQHVAAPTAGNAGGAMAAYASRAGMKSHVFMPRDTPVVNQYEAALYGAKAFLVDGLINDCGKIVGEGKQHVGWFDLSTLKEPYRIEGKKTMGLELAEQMGWSLPDVILYPTGGGTGLIGMWKGFAELGALGWLESTERPRMFSCQSSGCTPISDAFDRGERFAKAPENPATIAMGLRVPVAVGDFMILDAVRESSGRAMACEENEIDGWMRTACAMEGIAICPEAAACVGVLARAITEGHIGRDERVVIFNTGAAQKYVEAIGCDLPALDHTQPIDWEQFKS